MQNKVKTLGSYKLIISYGSINPMGKSRSGHWACIDGSTPRRGGGGTQSIKGPDWPDCCGSVAVTSKHC